MPLKKPLRGSRTHALERSSSRRAGWVRLTRTLVLGTVAVIAAVIWLAEQYGIEREVILRFLASSLIFIGLLIVAGFGGTLLIRGLRKLFACRRS